MPQKKVSARAKMKKPLKKAANTNSILNLAEKIEKEFRQIPTKLAKLYQQELTSQKQRENKLKDAIKKARALQKISEKKQADLAGAKETKAGKKQLVMLKKSIVEATKTVKAMTMQLNQIVKNTDELLAKQNKYKALTVELAKLEKQLTLKAKQPLLKSKKKTTPPVVKTLKATEEKMNEEIPFTLSSEPEVVEMSES